MTMGVQSYPELYTILIGWNLYDQMWSLLSQTGLAFLPFIGIIIKNIAKPYESQETKDATTTSMRRMEFDFIGTLFIILIGVAPILSLNPDVVSYTPVCQTNGQNNSYTPGNTQTTWDSAFTIPSQNIQVPLWWYAVIAMSEGITSASNTMLACTPDYRGMVSQVNVTQISDPELKQELQQFELECYIPARTQYLHDSQNNSGSNVSTINNDLSKYGTDDTEWMGSHSFQDTYYQNINATQAVKGFSYNPNQDINSDTNQTNPPAYGTPSCNQWWSDSQNGLKTRVSNALPTGFWTNNSNYFNTDTNDQKQDDVIKKVITNNNTGYQNANNTVSNYSYSNVASSLGEWFTQLDNYPKLYAAAQSAPIIQALLLLMIYTFLPFALVFSSYKISAFITGSMIIFSIIFWSFIWHLVSFVDSTLMNALYGNSWFSHQSSSATIVDMITGTLIFIAPLFWFSYMGAMGVAIGDIVGNAFTNLNQIGKSAAQEGVAITKSAAKIAAKAIL